VPQNKTRAGPPGKKNVQRTRDLVEGNVQKTRGTRSRSDRSGVEDATKIKLSSRVVTVSGIPGTKGRANQK